MVIHIQHSSKLSAIVADIAATARIISNESKVIFFFSIKSTIYKIFIMECNPVIAIDRMRRNIMLIKVF